MTDDWLIVSSAPPMSDALLATQADWLRAVVGAEIEALKAEPPATEERIADKALRMLRQRWPGIVFSAVVVGGTIRFTANGPPELVEQLNALGWKP